MSSDYDDLAIIEQQLPRSKSRDLCKARLNVLHIGTLTCPQMRALALPSVQQGFYAFAVLNDGPKPRAAVNLLIP
jgi:hypothetical protein